jgi:hypothetical protein
MHSRSPSGHAALATVQAQDLRPGQHTRGRRSREQSRGASGEGRACAGTAFLAACHKGDPESITTLGKEGTDALVGACSKSPRVHVSRPTHIARCRLVERHLPDPQGQWAACRSTRRKPPYEAYLISSTCIGRRRQTKKQPVLPPKTSPVRTCTRHVRVVRDSTDGLYGRYKTRRYVRVVTSVPWPTCPHNPTSPPPTHRPHLYPR